MPYVYVGLPSPYGGKPLFHILNNLKNFGVGRIVFKTTDYKNCQKPSFFRILYAQPEMDEKNHFGRVVVERVYRGVRTPEPVNISDGLDIPDFRLVPKSEEYSFCGWDTIRDYKKELDSTLKPKYMEVPPLLRSFLARSKVKKGIADTDEYYRLPAHKIYEGDYRLEERIETNVLSTFIKDEFADFKDFDMDSIPFEEWNHKLFNSPVCIRAHKSFVEGKGWEEREERRKKMEEMEQKVKDLRL